MTKSVAYSELVFDLDLYPRETQDAERWQHLREVLEAGEKLPPIIIDTGKRVVDGFHRARAYCSLHGAEVRIDCEVHTYADDAAFLLDAIRRNAKHGKPLSGGDRDRCVVLAERHGVAVEQLADVLSVRVERVKSLRGTSRPAAKATAPLVREPHHHVGGINNGYTDYAGPLGLIEINSMITTIRSGRIELRDRRIQESLRNLAKAALESLAGATA